jgi:dienelactone hydrolase
MYAQPLEAQTGYFIPPRSGARITLQLSAGGKTLATRAIRRTIGASTIGRAHLTLGSNGILGDFFTPAGSGYPAVVLIPGSDCRPADLVAELLARHGVAALALAYCGEPGLPDGVVRIPIEYFARAVEWVRKQSGVDRGHVSVVGFSRGSEAALLLASLRPRLADGVAVVAPSALVNRATGGLRTSAWAWRGRAVPYAGAVGTPSSGADGALAMRRAFERGLRDKAAVRRSTIPVTQCRARMLLVAGGADAVWPSSRYARMIVTQRRGHGVRLLEFPHAGHGITFAVPYLSAPAEAETRGIILALGGTRAADASARAMAWPELVSFLGGK